jgi:ABC-2 type transport system ATP-binding protein
MRDEFLGGLLELTENEGWTVWISSHDIEEVERFADRVVILNKGRVHLEDEVTVVRERFRMVEMVFDSEPTMPAEMPDSWLNLRISKRTARYTDSNFDESRSENEMRRAFPGIVRREVRKMNLREIFVALAKSYRGEPQKDS